MKGGSTLLALVLALTGCTTTQRVPNQRLSDEKYEIIVDLIKKQKARAPFKVVSETTLEVIAADAGESSNLERAEEQQLEEPKLNQTNTHQIIYSDSIYDFLRLNYGQHTVDALSLSNKYADVMTNLASIPNFQETIPALMDNLKKQVDRSYRGRLREEMPSYDAELALLSLIPSIQHNSELTDLVLNLQSKGVYLDITPAKESSQPNHTLPNVFLRVKDWQKSIGEKQVLEFSAQKFLEKVSSRYDLKDFVDAPEKLDSQLKEWLSEKKHHIQSSGSFFEDGHESWQNYKNLDLIQKLELYILMDELNKDHLRKESFELRDTDLMLEYTEVGGEINLLENSLHFSQKESTAQKFYPEENVPLMRIAGLTQDLDEIQRVQIYGSSEWLNEEQASQLNEEQKNLILEKYAENRNARLNISYSSDYSEGIGAFHLHSEIMRSSQVAGPSGWLTEIPFSYDGSLRIGGDLAAAALNLDYKGKHFMNVVITSIDEDKIDVNLYYASCKDGKPVNVSVGEFRK